jgi:NTP pyrophosphatase (non-canonical NTP hydrolase)
MRLNEYQRASMRTMSPIKELTISPRNQQLLHCILGVTGELGEIILSTDKHNLIEEIGDFMWYLSGAADTLGLGLEDIDLDHKVEEDPIDELATHVAIMADKLKRHIYYGVLLDDNSVERCIGACMVILDAMATECGVSLEECMITNIDKLTVRYPDKFDKGKAIRRNTHREMKTIREL